MKRLLLIIPVLIVAVLLIMPSVALADEPPAPITGTDPIAGPPTTQGVAATVWSGNPTGADIESAGPYSITVDDLPAPGESKTYDDGQGMTVTVTVDVNGDYFDWTSNYLVDTVIVQDDIGDHDGFYANVYRCSPNEIWDGGLHPPIHDGQPYHLSHIIFCHHCCVPPVPEASSIVLLSLGLLAVAAVGGFVWYGTYRRKQVA